MNGSDNNQINIGSTVKVRMNGSEKLFSIGHTKEADPGKGIISDECPIGKALLGAKQGDKISCKVGGNILTVEILDVQ